MKKIKNIILGLGFFLIIEFFLAVFAFTFLIPFYDSFFILDNSLLIESITFGIGTFLIGLYLIFFDFSEKSLKTSIKKANRRFANFWRQSFLVPFKFIKNNPIFASRVLIVLIAIFLSFQYISVVYDVMSDDGQWEWILHDSLSRSLVLIHFAWAFTRLFILWMITFAILTLLKNKD